MTATNRQLLADLNEVHARWERTERELIDVRRERDEARADNARLTALLDGWCTRMGAVLDPVQEAAR